VFLAGFGVGALFSGPFSETFGRSIVYISTLIIFMIFVMASALAPNFGAQVAFRFLAGFFGSTPLTAAGGTIADMWDPLEKTYSFPLFSIFGFSGPVLGPVIGSYIGTGSLSTWRWSEWITLITAALVLAVVFLFQPETYAPILMKWKAQQLRKITGDSRYCAEIEIIPIPFWSRVRAALTRPFALVIHEPIIFLIGLYMTVLYIVLFTFLDGYTYIFTDVYHLSQGLTNVVFAGICVGMVLASALVAPLYSRTRKEMAEAEATPGKVFEPESRLWFAMLGGSPAIPISLLWMGWTDYSSISVWSPIVASVLFGYGVITIFISSYMYLIEVYQSSAASALAFVTFMRYLCAGGMTVVGIPFYRNMGTHWTLTILGCISLLMVPIPYVFYKYGRRIRGHSTYAVHV
jgi:multidrug resistance protein